LADLAQVQSPLWTPSKEQIEGANITAFMRAAATAWNVDPPDYAALYKWSIRHPDQFWQLLWDFTGVIASHRGDTIIENQHSMLEARWFPEARLNFAENLLRRRDDATAIVLWSEAGIRRRVSYRELYDHVSRLARALTELGIKKDDRVGAVLPNIPETLMCMLAVNSLGAIWSCCSPDFGVQGAVDRLGQVAPKLLFGTDGYYYNGKFYDALPRLAETQKRLPSLEHVILVPFIDSKRVQNHPQEWLEFNRLIADSPAATIPFARLPFDQPAFILFTSGTTGAPKCILHAAGRSLLKLLKEHWLHFDVKPDDAFFYFTTTGWNMWYTLITAIAAGGTILMYEGSPFHPKKDILFDFADAENMAIFGASPKYFDTMRKFGLSPIKTHRLSALRTVLSTGAPLSADSFDYVYEGIKQNVRLSSISGGTELMATFANGNPIGPVWRSELQARALGMQVEVFDEDGNSVVGQKGELVCTAPFVSRPLCFLNDPGNQRYYETYFSRFPGVWYHGDYAEITDHDGLIIYGRSDATLKPGGVRVGTSEIYRPVESLDEVVDALVVGQEWNDDIRIVLFVKLRDDLKLDAELVGKIVRQIRDYATPRHVPAKVIQVPEIPYTLNGKKTELAVHSVIHGKPVRNTSSIANPRVLEYFRDLPELRT
jgi:acetoacetyl-CoA synthetase